MNQRDPTPRHSPAELLNIIIASKETLKEKLFSLLKMPDFDGKEPSLFDLVENLLTKLVDDISFLIEFPYVDRHYRDTYYSFHSSKFGETGRNCIRVHILEGTVKNNDIFQKESNFNERYYGFFIIRPLMMHILGRSLISPKAYKEKDFVCCLMKDRVSLLGNELTVCGFPHIAQDTETHTCAESALWCLYEYYGSKYSQYKPLLPSQIIEPIRNNAEHRMLPSRGLKEKELAICLNSNGFQSLDYPIVFYKEGKSTIRLEHKPIFRLINTYIESGIPLLLLLEGRSGHTVLVIGHEEDTSIYYNKDSIPWAKYAHYSWVDVSFIHKRLIFIDDNKHPYFSSSLLVPGKEPFLTYREWTVNSFIVPLPAHMFLTAEKAYDFIKLVFNNPIVGLEKKDGKWVTRLLLTSSHSFKKFIFNHNDKMAPYYKKYLLRLSLPRFIWICEIYEAENFVKDGYCSGLLIIDATSDGKSLESALFYMLNKEVFTHNGFIWNNPNTIDGIASYKMQTYKNNLKGEWNQWMTS